MYSTQLFELMETLGFNKPISLVGTSQGGTIAAQFTLRYPDLVTRVCMLAPFVDKLERKSLALLRKPIIGDLLIRLVSQQKLMDQSAGFRDAGRWPAFQNRLLMVWNTADRRRAILANLRGDALEDASGTFEALANLGKPLRLLWGDKDQSIRRESIDHLRDLLPDCDYSEVPDAAHLMHVEFPERINPLILEFLNN